MTTAPTARHRRAFIHAMAEVEADVVQNLAEARARRPGAPAHVPLAEASAWAWEQVLAALQAIPAPEVPQDDTVGQDTLDGMPSTPVENPVEEVIPEDIHYISQALGGLHAFPNVLAVKRWTEDAAEVTCPVCRSWLDGS